MFCLNEFLSHLPTQSDKMLACPAGHNAHESKRCLLLGRKAMTSLDSILKSRDITLLTRVHRGKAVVFLVDMFECQSWTVKKAECQRTDAFKLCCWRRSLKVLWTARRSDQSILKERLMLKLKLHPLSA